MEIKVLQESTPGVDFCSCMCLISNPPRWVWLDETKKKNNQLKPNSSPEHGPQFYINFQMKS